MSIVIPQNQSLLLNVKQNLIVLHRKPEVEAELGELLCSEKDNSVQPATLKLKAIGWKIILISTREKHVEWVQVQIHRNYFWNEKIIWNWVQYNLSPLNIVIEEPEVFNHHAEVVKLWGISPGVTWLKEDVEVNFFPPQQVKEQKGVLVDKSVELQFTTSLSLEIVLMQTIL